MKRWKKILLALLLVVLISQVPFAYRRYKLGRLNAQILSLQSQRQTAIASDGLLELVGVSHVHSFLGGHSSGTFQELIAAANSNQLDFVLLSEHPDPNFDTGAMTLQGKHGHGLFLSGNEVVTASGDRVLIFPGTVDANMAHSQSTADFLARHQNGLVFVAYPDSFKAWNAEHYDGVEVYNVYTNSKQINPLTMFFDGVWSYGAYPDLLFARFYSRPTENLKLWDSAIGNTGKRLIGIAGNDAHSNVGLSLNDATGNTLVGFKFDPYERSFRLVRVHALLRLPLDDQLNEKHLVKALSNGNCFIGFDIFGDTQGFRFFAHDGNEQAIMGDEIALDDAVRLNVQVPIPARVVLFKNGVPIKDDSNVRAQEFLAKEKGSYRVEVYLPQLGSPLNENPWIIANPIYVK